LYSVGAERPEDYRGGVDEWGSTRSIILNIGSDFESNQAALNNLNYFLVKPERNKLISLQSNILFLKNS